MSIEKYTAYTGMLHVYGVYKHHGIPYIKLCYNYMGDVPQLLILVKPYTLGFTMCTPGVHFLLAYLLTFYALLVPSLM